MYVRGHCSLGGLDHRRSMSVVLSFDFQHVMGTRHGSKRIRKTVRGLLDRAQG